LDPRSKAILAEPFPAVAVAVIGARGRKEAFKVTDPLDFGLHKLSLLPTPGPIAFTALSSMLTVGGGKLNVVKLKINGRVVVGGLNAVHVPLLLRYS
jgi:hypothetical protein